MTSKTHGYIFALLAITIFSLQDAISKHLASAYPPIFVTMIRYWAFALFTIILASKMRGGLKATARTKRPLLQVVRGVLLAVQVVLAITCFAIIGLARSQAIFSATPILIALLSMPILGERVGWRRWVAIGAGLFGVLLILKPEGEFFDVKLLLAITSCFNFAFYVIATRLVSRDDSAMTSFFYTGVIGGITMTIPSSPTLRFSETDGNISRNSWSTSTTAFEGTMTLMATETSASSPSFRLLTRARMTCRSPRIRRASSSIALPASVSFGWRAPERSKSGTSSCASRLAIV